MCDYLAWRREADLITISRPVKGYYTAEGDQLPLSTRRRRKEEMGLAVDSGISRDIRRFLPLAWGRGSPHGAAPAPSGEPKPPPSRLTVAVAALKDA